MESFALMSSPLRTSVTTRVYCFSMLKVSWLAEPSVSRTLFHSPRDLVRWPMTT